MGATANTANRNFNNITIITITTMIMINVHSRDIGAELLILG